MTLSHPFCFLFNNLYTDIMVSWVFYSRNQNCCIHYRSLFSLCGPEWFGMVRKPSDISLRLTSSQFLRRENTNFKRASRIKFQNDFLAKCLSSSKGIFLSQIKIFIITTCNSSFKTSIIGSVT